jgi:ceramide synthetase
MVHDVSDIFLESAKLFKYGGAIKVSEVLFASFAASWFITRLGIYPTWIIYSATVEAPQLIQYFPGYFVFNALLSALLLLNIVWAYLICKVVYNSLMANETIANDIRSDTSEDGKDATTGTTDGSDNEILKRKTQ